MPQLLDRDLAAAPRADLAAGPEQGVIEEARRLQRRRRIRATTAALLAGALAGAGVWALSGGAAHAGTAHARAPGTVEPGLARAAQTPGFNLRVVPSLTVGYVGWCIVVEEGRRTGGSACGGPPTSSSPFLEEFGWGSVSSHRETLVDVTTPQVAAIRLDGRVVPTVALPGLPYGLRATRVVFRSETHPLPPVALDAAGRPIAPGSSGYERTAPVRSWSSPQPAARGLCGLRAIGMFGLAVRGGEVLAALPVLPGKLVGRAFLPCAETDFRFQNVPVDAEILLDAAAPGARPAALPDWRPVAGAPGFFAEGGATATRFANTWLVARQGSSVGERMRLLRHLIATVTL